ncbi:MAG: hypothetical protein KAT86_00795 [Candidatus Latescibacteria bacterium]|nr:hypothetical protein [Candidatus Latescibacterota bacterium]
MTRCVLLFLFFSAFSACVASLLAAEFQNLGIPVKKAGLMGSLVGPDENGELTRLYFNFNQNGAPLFLMQVDPESGAARQLNAPKGPGAWGFIVGPDKKIYLGTWDGGLILRFDPKQPDKDIEVVGRPSKTETYIWMFTIGKDDKLYGCTYENAKLISYDPKTGEMADLGRMDPTENYSRSVATGQNGWIYVGIGMARGSIVAYNPQTGKHLLAIPKDHVVQGCGQVWNGKDGNAYGRMGGHTYRFLDGKGTVIKDNEAVGKAPQKLKDGRTLTGANREGWYTLYNPKTEKIEKRAFKYVGAGSSPFVVSEGPEGIIYGSTALPLELFWYDPRTGEMKNPGNPTSVNGEIYSFVHLGEKLYMCAYPGGWLSVYDPEKPWNYGTKPENNPYGFGRIGDGHLRPRAMIVGQDKRLYIGSLPPYGQLGGALGVYDPDKNQVVENYRNLIPNQSIVALVQEPTTGLIFGGTSVAGGGGAHVTEKDAHLFAWDPEKKEKVIDIIPVPGRGTVISIAQAKEKVFATLSGPTLVVYDVTKREIVHQADISLGNPLEISLGLWKDGLIYGLTDRCIFTIDPKTYEITEFASPRGHISCGWAITETGIYFGSGVHLMRWKW